jgi:hypothetical protein
VTRKRPILDRFNDLVQIDAEPHPTLGSPCWLWVGATNTKGYGRFRLSGGHRGKGSVVAYAHRWAYTQWNGDIPDGYEVDHVCENPSCVNPAHLNAVPPDINRGYQAGVYSRAAGPPPYEVEPSGPDGHGPIPTPPDDGVPF